MAELNTKPKADGRKSKIWFRGVALALPICSTAFLTPVHAQMGYDPNTDPNMAFARGLDAQMQGFNRSLGDIDKCYGQNDQEACASARAYSEQQQRMIGIWGGLNQSDQIYSGIDRSMDEMNRQNELAHDRDMARGYFGYADQDRANGNDDGAQYNQSMGNYFQQKSLELEH